MSVQLEIFPQNYLGYVTAFTPPPLELITDGQVFGANLPPAQDPIIAKRLITDSTIRFLQTFFSSISLITVPKD